MKNKMQDVRNHLVAQMEALGDENISAEEMTARVKRANATVGLAGAYIDSVKVEVDAIRIADTCGFFPASMEKPAQLVQLPSTPIPVRPAIAG